MATIDVTVVGWFNVVSPRDPDLEGTWEIPRQAYIDGAEYRAGDRLIWSIGVDGDGRVYCAYDDRFFRKPRFTCIWLR